MKYKVKITVSAKKTFTYDIEANSQRSAGDQAFDRAIDDFTASTQETEEDDCEIEQQTKCCEECGKEYEVRTEDRNEAPDAWTEDDDYCAKCGEEIVAKESEAVSDARYTAKATERKARTN